jgi:hypothetical protein
MKEEKKSKGGLGKFLLGIGVAAIAVVAYNKIPAVKNVCDKAGEGIKKGATKIGESLKKCGEKKQDQSAENTATQQAPKTESAGATN